MATQYASSIPTKRLAAAILTTDSSFALNNILDWNGVALTSADFGTRAFGCFRNTSNTQIEFFEFSPTTIASASITIVARGLSFLGGTVDGVETKYAWPANSTLVELGATVPQLFEQYLDKTSDQTVDGLITFTQTPVGINPGGQPDSSTTVKGIGKVSVAPVSPTSPIFVGDNDSRVPTAAQVSYIPTTGQKDALSSTTTPSASNLYMTQVDVQKNAIRYTASTTGNDTYVATFSPAITALIDGMELFVKVDTVNTGAATLNPNAVGATSILRNDGSALADGDIPANGIMHLIYNSTSTAFRLQNAANSPKYFHTTTTRDMTAASGAVTIAHGFGRAPRFVDVEAMNVPAANSAAAVSLGSFDGSTNKSAYVMSVVIGGTQGSGTDTTNGIHLELTAGGSQVAIISADATNITLTYTKSGSPTGTAVIRIRAEV